MICSVYRYGHDYVDDQMYLKRERKYHSHSHELENVLCTEGRRVHLQRREHPATPVRH
jgi:tryptophan synthase beta subunit